MWLFYLSVLLLGFHERGPKPCSPPPPNPPMKKTAIQSYRINKGKQNTCIYACTKTLCRNVQDFVVRIIVWWVTKTHRYCMHTNVNIYCTSQYIYVKKLVAWTIRQRLANHETSSASRPTSSTDTTSFSFSYSSAAIIFCFFDKLKLKLRKVRFILSALRPFKPTIKDGSFSKDSCNVWSNYEQLTIRKKSHR